MSRARILADYVSSGDELADKAPLASPAFTGTPTGITAAHLTTAAVLPAAVTGGSGLTALGTVTAGVLEDAVEFTGIEATGTLKVSVNGGTSDVTVSNSSRYVLFCTSFHGTAVSTTHPSLFNISVASGGTVTITTVTAVTGITTVTSPSANTVRLTDVHATYHSLGIIFRIGGKS